MQRFLLACTLPALAWMGQLQAEPIDIEVFGMTCTFCVDSLQRNLEKLPDIESATVSLQHRKVRIETAGDPVDLERVRQTILDTGFTPVRIIRNTDAD